MKSLRSCPVGVADVLQDQVRDLRQKPAGNHVSQADPENISALEFVEKIQCMTPAKSSMRHNVTVLRANTQLQTAAISSSLGSWIWAVPSSVKLNRRNARSPL